MPDYSARRTMMVDTQVRPSDVTKFPIIDAMLSVPREAFVPADKLEAAYVGENLELAPGRVLLEPRTLAKMLDAIDIQREDLVLDIGSGLGYSSAVIGHIAQAVVAVESDEAMAEEAQQLLMEHGADGVALHQGALSEGAAEFGPYDAICIQGGVEVVPDALLDQLKDEGRIICLFMEGSLGVVRMGHKQNGAVSWRFAFNAAAPVLSGFEKQDVFTL
ncbi:protein-L-isoaspartate O-methyltransferase family protein [Primorskyibacter sp. S187A]|uniref:protein-L-isoaspartate O-methyltransferase family protein n=1 Tax=Primorskyibacter sp. S187A TaxID=3415130 RepID=UPI003C7DA393